MSKTRSKDAPEINTDTLPEAGEVSPGEIPRDEPTDTEGTAKPAPAADMRDVDEVIAENAIPAWKGAALCRAEGWAPGKRITDEEFQAALVRIKQRRMGG